MEAILPLCHSLNIQPIITIAKDGILQGSVDNKGRFVDIYVGWPGRVHDARVFDNSTCFNKVKPKHCSLTGQRGSATLMFLL